MSGIYSEGSSLPEIQLQKRGSPGMSSNDLFYFNSPSKLTFEPGVKPCSRSFNQNQNQDIIPFNVQSTSVSSGTFTDESFSNSPPPFTLPPPSFSDIHDFFDKPIVKRQRPPIFQSIQRTLRSTFTWIFSQLSLSNFSSQEVTNFSNSLLTLATVSIFLLLVFNIHLDVRAQLHHQALITGAEIESCTDHYIANKCSPIERVPAMQKQCKEWEICMNKQPISTLGYGPLVARVIATTVEAFLEPLSIRSVGALALLLTIYLLSKRKPAQSHVHHKVHFQKNDNVTASSNSSSRGTAILELSKT